MRDSFVEIFDGFGRTSHYRMRARSRPWSPRNGSASICIRSRRCDGDRRIIRPVCVILRTSHLTAPRVEGVWRPSHGAQDPIHTQPWLAEYYSYSHHTITLHKTPNSLYRTPSYDRICASTDFFLSIDSNENANEPHAWPASRQAASWRQMAASFLDSGRVEALGNRKRKTKVGLGDWSSPTGNRTPVGGGISQLTVMKIRNDNHYTTGESPWFQTRWHFRNWCEHFICT